MLTARCQCGEVFHAEESHAGRRLRCRCGRVVVLPVRVQAAPTRRETAEPRPPSQPKARPRRRSGPRVEGGARARLARWVERVSWGYLAAAIAACAVLWGLGDRWVPATAFLFAGKWPLLLPLAVLVPLAVGLRARLLLPLAAAAGVVLVGVMGWRAGVRLPAGGDVRMPLRVVTFNADGGAGAWVRLPDLLETWRPDVVAFQECGGPLAEAIPALPGWHHHEKDSLCLLSRYPIVAAEMMDRSALLHVAETSSVGGTGIVIRYTLRTPAGPVSLTNVHLETPRKGFEALAGFGWTAMRTNTELRAIEAHLARAWVDGGTAPRLVVGDFNTPVESRIFQEHWSGLTDAWEAAGRGFGWTKDNGWIRVRIDHVLMGRGWRARRISTSPDAAGSDHHPVIADLQLLERR
ncbi:MAG TPA: endonuclease/exonuclease/phosphatase family protein [Longimicrobium sp.]